MTEKEEPLIKIINLHRTFSMGEVEVPVLKGIDLEIYPGEMVVILGPSGSGKTTLLNLVGGMDQPDKGEVIVGGEHLEKLTGRELTHFRRHTVGFIFQMFNLISTLTARENIQVSTEIASHPLEIDEVLEMVGLTDRAEHFPAQLSGGEQQRVAVARALAKNPKILLCDEPTGALDFETGKKVLKLLDKLNRELEMTLLIITHNVAIGEMAHRVIHMISGQIHSIEKKETRVSPEEISW